MAEQKPHASDDSGGSNRLPHEVQSIKPVWRSFVGGLKVLMVVDADNRPLDQFLAVRDHALGIVQSEVFENQLEKEWFEANLQPDVRAGLIAEMGAVPRAFEVSQATGSAAEQKGWRKHLLEVSSTVVESVKDFFSNSNNGYVKSALTLLKESVDIYKGW